MEYYGYIYKTTNLLTGKIYIGKKAYVHRIKKKLTKKELALLPKGRKPKYKYVEVDSGYKDYYGSSIELKADIERLGKDNFKVTVLKKCLNKTSLGYWEEYYQHKYKVLFTDTYNGNIGGRFFKGKIHE